MPLNLKPPADEPKDKMVSAALVQATAKVYAERHGLCEVVDEALAEMGIGHVSDVSTLCYAIVNVPHVVEFYADPNQWADLSPEEEVQRVTAAIKPGRPARLSIREEDGIEEGDYDLFGPVEVVSLSTTKPKPPAIEAGGWTLPAGYHPLVANAGTVVHLASSGGYDFAVCGASNMHTYDGRRVTSICKRCSAAVS